MSRRSRLLLCLMATVTGCGLLPSLAQAALTNTAHPTISGTPEVGQTLTLTQGTWTDTTDPAITVTDEWERCDTNGANCTGVSSAGTYPLTSADAGSTIEVLETASTTADGSASISSAHTATVTQPPPPVPANTVAPAISGTAQQGLSLTASTGTWTNSPTSYTYQWKSCAAATCTNVGSNSTSYVAAATDVGRTIEVTVTASNAGGAGAPATSQPTASVIATAPANTALPAITGAAQQGVTLTASTGTWTNTPTSYAYQWESCSGATCVGVGTNSNTYVVAATDVGKTIEVAVTATNTGGSAVATSAPTAVVIALVPVISVAPTITGTAQQGQTLTASTGTWTNSPVSYAYQWESCTGATCTAIASAIAATYVPVAADVGKTIEVQVTATNTGGTSAAATSLATATVVPPVPSATFAPSISGSPIQGSVLTEVHGGWTNAPTSYTYQWQRCDSTGANCVAIASATNQSYPLTAADVGGRLLVLETATNAGGKSLLPASSALTSVITTPALVVPVPASTSPPTLAGGTEQGQTLVESHGTWNGNPGSFSYQWERCNGAGCAAIPGANGQTYTLTGADVGQSIAVVETAANTGGAGAATGSARSAVVIATSSITLALVPGTAVTNQTVTLAATVTSSSGNADPAGSLSFSDGGAPIGGCTNQSFTSSGQSTTIICQAAFGAGTHQLGVSYQAGAGALVGASTSAPQTLVVGKNSTSVSLAVTKQVAVLKRATYVATVVPPTGNSGPAEPTGSVEFMDRGHPIAGCASLQLTTLTATCVVKYRATGSHRISARYNGDPNFGGSTSPVRSVLAGKNASGPVVLGFISSTLQWKFYYSPRYTQVLQLQAFGVANASSLRLTCRGAGCPFAMLQSSLAGAAGCSGQAHQICSNGSSMNLLPAFHKRHLGAGAQIIVWITRPHWIGRYFSFSIRAGQPPLFGVSCLAVGRTRPGVGC